MAKYRCPRCGATHKEQTEQCRLCGQRMVSEHDVAQYTGGARQQIDKPKGLGKLFFIALGGVLVIALVALVLGLVPSNSFINSIRDKIPGLKVDSSDGWRQVEEPGGSFVAQFPGEPTTRTIPFSASPDNRITSVVVKVGDETELSVSYGTVSQIGEESAKAELERLGDIWAAQTGFKVSQRTETGFMGYPALLLEQTEGKLLGQYATQRSMLVLKGDRLYVIQSTSVYKDHPQFERLANGVAFTA